MNEHVRNLFGQALDQAVPYTWHNLDHVEVEKVMKVFAELLVYECMEQVHYTREDMINENISQVIKDRIEKHFGVE